MEIGLGSSNQFSGEEHKSEHSFDNPIADILGYKPFIQGRFGKLKKMQWRNKASH